jgi:FixH
MNWGNRLLVTFLVFGAGMGFLVYKAINTNFELVDKEYYKNELRYQEVIDGIKRANALSDVVKLAQTDKGVILQMPSEMMNQKISGSVYLYCAYNSKRDKQFALITDDKGMQVLDVKSIAPGDYTARINWNANGNNYYTEKPITIH